MPPSAPPLPDAAAPDISSDTSDGCRGLLVLLEYTAASYIGGSSTTSSSSSRIDAPASVCSMNREGREDDEPLADAAAAASAVLRLRAEDCIEG
jgi:hypothetical protein